LNSDQSCHQDVHLAGFDLLQRPNVQIGHFGQSLLRNAPGATFPAKVRTERFQLNLFFPVEWHALLGREPPHCGHGAIGRKIRLACLKELPYNQRMRGATPDDEEPETVVEFAGLEFMIEKIVSGAQTGADRAALDFAIEHNFPHGGWCPKGRLAEDGVIDERYQVKETSTNSYPQRTEKNVQNSDGTVIFTMKPTLTGGSKKTAEFAQTHLKPWIHLHPGKGADLPANLLKFIRDNQIRVLNIGGSRASKEPDVYDLVQVVLRESFKEPKDAFSPKQRRETGISDGREVRRYRGGKGSHKVFGFKMNGLWDALQPGRLVGR